MRKTWVAVLALACAWPAAAQESAPTPDFAAMSEAELGERVNAIGAEGFANPCRDKVPLFAEFLRRHPDHAGLKSGSLTAQAFCAYEEERDEDGLKLLKQAESVFDGPAFHGLGLYFATQLEDGAEALARLRSIARERQLASLPVDSVSFGIRTVRRDGLDVEFDEFGFELAASSEFARLDPELQSAFASAGVRHSVRIGDLPKVDELLGYVSNPSSYQIMLSDRTYEAAWPQIEERAGDNLRKVVEAYARLTAERLSEKPEDRDRLTGYAYALLYAGRFQEAVDVARNWRPQRDSLAGIEEGDAWALNIEAYALDALGRPDEADAVFDQLATVSPDEHYWVVNFVINRASRLVGQERWEEGLAATELARSVAEEQGSTFAKLLVARDRACALQRLGRIEDARREAEFLVEQFNESAAVATTGLMCVGQEEQAEQLLAAALQDEVARGGLIYDIQDPRFELFYTPTALPQARALILADEALREEVFKHVRIIPERFVPVSYLRRKNAAAAAP